MKSALLEDEDELVLVLVERPAAALISRPDANTDLLEPRLQSGIDQLVGIRPTRAQVMQRTRAAIKREQRTDLCQEPPALAAEGRNSIDLTRIAQGLCEDHRGAILTHKQFVRKLIDRTAAIDQV
jgi:hypothetical protein